MGFLKSTVNYMCRDVIASTQFYTEVLGMQYIIGVKEGTEDAVPEFGDGTPLAFVILRRGDVDLMLLSRAAVAADLPAMAASEPSATAMLYIEVDDVESLYASIKGKAALQADLHDTFYSMREFTITDPDGYFICFAQRLPQSQA